MGVGCVQSPSFPVYPIFHPNLLLLTDMRVESRIAYGEETREFVVFRRADHLLHVFGFLLDWDMQSAGQSFGGSGKQDILYRRPHGGEIVQGTETGGPKERTARVKEKGQDESARLGEHPLLLGHGVHEHGITS